jgi:hypothetical protein
MTNVFFRTKVNICFCGVRGFFAFISFDNFSYCRARKHGTANEENFCNIGVHNHESGNVWLACREGMRGRWGGSKFI